RLAEATPTYLRGVKSQFLDLLGAGDVGEVRALLARLDVTDAC
ncbi:MAG: MarR family transcriptional regulator, partial [Nonomuraea sp.]|nr:MarR family transcriptional regulator [Nonomuraea sp.]